MCCKLIPLLDECLSGACLNAKFPSSSLVLQPEGPVQSGWNNHSVFQ